jgi:uncharacterized protein YkwD
LTIPRILSPHHVIGRAATLGGVALMAAALLAWTPQPATGFNTGAAEATLFQLMNGARVNNGRRAVQQHSTLVSLARWRSKDQVERDYFDHTIKGTGYQVYHWYDLNGLQYSWGGENIGWNNGYSDGDSPVAIHEGFMNSPGHRANILEPSFTHGGVGAYAKDNVMFLGKQRSPRFYTELFMAATAAPPPPSGGGGGGSGSGGSTGGGTPAPTQTNPEPKEKQPRNLRVDQPAAPRASEPVDGPTLVAGRASEQTAAGALRGLAYSSDAPPATTAAASNASGSMRIEAAGSTERGLFETILGSLLGFVL